MNRKLEMLRKGSLFARRIAGASNIAAILLPIALIIIIFLVFYNNIIYGKVLLALVAGIAILACKIPARWLSTYVNTTLLRMVFLYIASIFGAWLFLEILFPYVFSKDYTQLMEFTKAVRGHDFVPASCVNEIFENDDQRIYLKKQYQTVGQNSKISWHRPGERFQYLGYDPNSGITYLNRFYWNERGYFDHDRPLVKSPKTQRIVVIGDSYVEAIQVPLSKTFHKRMEKMLNGKVTTNVHSAFEVIALGNSGTGQLNNLNVLKNLGMDYAPDLVMFTLCTNDFCDDDPVLKRELILYSGELGPITRGLVRHGLMAAVLIVQRVESMRRSRVTISPELLQWSADHLPFIEKAWERTLNYIYQAKVICDKAKVPFLLVYLGSEIEVSYALEPAKTLAALRGMGAAHSATPWDLERSVRRVAVYCAEHKIEFISVLEPLIQAQNRTNKLVFGDHYTIFGHEIVGRVLACAAWRCLSQSPPCRLEQCLNQENWP